MNVQKYGDAHLDHIFMSFMLCHLCTICVVTVYIDELSFYLSPHQSCEEIKAAVHNALCQMSARHCFRAYIG
jgi:hypothetical protein